MIFRIEVNKQREPHTLGEKTRAEDDASRPLFPWPIAALVGGIAAAVAGWLVLAGICLCSWFSVLTTPLSQVLGFATQAWLLGNGVPLVQDGVIGIVPLGLSGLSVLLVHWSVRVACQQARLARPDLNRMNLAARVAGLSVVGYLAIVLLLTWTNGRGSDMAYGLIGGVIIAGLGAIWGCSSAFKLLDFTLLPLPLVRLVRGTASGCALLALASVAVVISALIINSERVAVLEAGLQLDTIGALTWGFAVVAYLPNLLIWGLSWALGAGFSVGSGSMVTIFGTQLGLLPNVPLFGLLPAVGVAPWTLLCWMLTGIAAGILAGVITGLPKPLPQLWKGMLVGCGAGAIMTGIVWVLAWASRGDLGTLRLVELGPFLSDLAIITGALFVLCAVVGSLLVRLPAGGSQKDAVTDELVAVDELSVDSTR